MWQEQKNTGQNRKRTNKEGKKKEQVNPALFRYLWSFLLPQVYFLLLLLLFFRPPVRLVLLVEGRRYHICEAVFR